MRPGQKIKGYRLNEKIGAGGFGDVYRATRESIGGDVAIKIIRREFASQPDYIRRFETEAQIVARLDHLHIVPLYDYWRDPEGAYLVMRWMRGGNLHDALAHGPLDAKAAVVILTQISGALAAAHRDDVIHRDLKPANILFDEEGNAYLADFGIAKFVGNRDGNITATDSILGSLDYIAPEQARHERVSPQTDIYSLGIVLYEMLAGEHPFLTATSVERMYKHLNDSLPTLSALDETVASEINAVIQKATAKNPDRRYADALEMAAAFRAAAGLDRPEAGATLVEQLTLREHEILKLIMDGCANQEIAEKLFVTVPTVKWHARQIYRKLRVRNRVQAIVRARELNLITSTPQGPAGDTQTTSIMLPEPQNPYKGLRAFQAADAPDFFGRERLVARLVERMNETDHLARFLAVVGPSGSGKSSLAKAGLMPALWRGALPGSERWFVVEMVPGARPMDELEIALTRVAADQADHLREQLDRDKHGLLRVAGLILPADGSELALIIDQFEEVFTLVQNESERQQFLDLIRAAVTDPRSRVRVVVTLRADFYDRPLHYPAFGDLMRQRMETILPLSAAELEAAIVKPASRVGVQFEDGLVALITSEINYQPGALPLLQYALTELFERRDGRTLTLQAFEDIGRAVGALTQRADDLYREQDDAGQVTIRQMFLRLVTLGEGTEDTRRRVPQSELRAIASDPDLMDEIIGTFAAYRLLSLDHDPVTRSPTVEVAHEALLREWERLRDWLHRSREDVRLQRQLSVSAAEWRDAQHEPSYLLRGARLAQFERWSADTDLALTPDERAFLDASVLAREQLAMVERERGEREGALRQRIQRAIQLVTLISLVAAIVGVGLAIFALNQRDTAKGERDNARQAQAEAEAQASINLSLRLASDAKEEFEAGKVDLALALALAAVSTENPPARAVEALRTVALGPGTRAILKDQGNAIRTVAFSSDRQRALSGSCGQLNGNDTCAQGELIVWDLVNQTELIRLVGHTGWVNSVAFSPDGLTALSGSDDNTLILWNLDANSPLFAFGEMIHRFEGHTGWVNSVAFSPDGFTALSGSSDNSLILWDLSTGDLVYRFEGHTDAVNVVAFRPTQDHGDPLIALSGSDDSNLILWDVRTREVMHRLEHEAAIHIALFTPDGNTIISGGSGVILYEWDANTGEEIQRTTTGLTASFAAVTPDGLRVIAGSGAMDMLWLWDVASLQWDADLVPVSRPVSIAISPDGDTILSGSQDGNLSLLNFEVSLELRRFVTNGTPQGSMALSSDGRRLLTTAVDRCGATLWDVETGQAIRSFGRKTQDEHGTELVAADVAFHPDGRRALLNCANWEGGVDKTWLAVWDTENGTVIHELQGHKFNVRDIAISPDGRYAISGSMSWVDHDIEKDLGELILWDLDAGQLVRQFEHDKSISGVDFSADGQRVVASSNGAQNVTVWDVNTGKVIYRIDNIGGVADAIFGPDETTVLTAMTSTYLILWDLESGTVVRRFVGHETFGYKMELSPDGRYLISRDFTAGFILWDFETGDIVRRLGTHPGYTKNFVFSPNGKTIFISYLFGQISEIRIADWSLEDLLAWVEENRYIRALTDDERARYRIE